jgi:Fe2+ transport system protein B
MKLIDKNQTLLIDLADPLEPRTEPFSQTQLDQMTLQPVTGVSLFVVTLFIPFKKNLNVAYHTNEPPCG